MARRRRWLAPAELDSAVYHCTSRVVDRQFVFGAAEKEHFVALMRELAEFCGVHIITFCVMSNHFHLLVRVPRAPERLPDREEVLAKLARLSGTQDVEGIRRRFDQFRESADVVGEEIYLATFHARMWNLSWYMKLLKQRFSQWYNRRAQRKGTLWEERFGSVIVEGRGRPMVAVAGYIDLNPVRAAIVADPGEYRWSGYGEAMAGNRDALEGVRTIAGAIAGEGGVSAAEALEMYRMQIYPAGKEEPELAATPGNSAQNAQARDEMVRVLNGGGRLPLPEYLHCRSRYFSAGAALGSKPFIETLFASSQTRFGRKRATGARRMRGLGEPLYAIRDLQKAVFN